MPRFLPALTFAWGAALALGAASFDGFVPALAHAVPGTDLLVAGSVGPEASGLGVFRVAGGLHRALWRGPDEGATGLKVLEGRELGPGDGRIVGVVQALEGRERLTLLALEGGRPRPVFRGEARSFEVLEVDGRPLVVAHASGPLDVPRLYLAGPRGLRDVSEAHPDCYRVLLEGVGLEGGLPPGSAAAYADLARRAGRTREARAALEARLAGPLPAGPGREAMREALALLP